MYTTTRHSPPLFKKPGASKTARSVPAAKNALTPRITVKGAGKAAKQTKDKNEDELFRFDESEDEMATSFLQYW